MCLTKKQRYACYGVDFDGTYVKSPVYGYIRPLLKVGNDKVGRKVYTFSLLAGAEYYTLVFGGVKLTQRGTCSSTCSCDGKCTCYGFYGRLKMDAARRVAFMNTTFMRFHRDWLERALCAQIEADHLTLVRIHQTGDFETQEYADMWRRIAERFPWCKFWTYTKERDKEALFDGLSNANIVRSLLPTGGYNYGTCEYVMGQYAELTAQGYRVAVCGCGTPHEKHCEDCTTCSKNPYVLFLQHSTPDYNAKKDKAYKVYCDWVKEVTA